MNEKILVISKQFYLDLYKDGLDEYANSNEDQIDLYCLDYPKKSLSWIDKLKYKYDINGFKKDYYDKVRKDLIETIKEYSQILFIDLFFDGEYFIQGELETILSKKNTKVYFVDSIKTVPQDIPFLHIFNHIYSFEYQDIEYAEEKYGVKVEYVTAGSSYYLYPEMKQYSESQRIYDLCFVGNVGPKRLAYLDEIAKYCKKSGKRFFCSGHFWHDNNMWNYYVGKLKFKLKHPELAEFAKNQYITPNELATVYLQSKICLNINFEYHKNLNQRVYDLLLCACLGMCDVQDATHSKLTPDQDFVMCKNPVEMVEKIDYYLEHEEKSQKIVTHGFDIVNREYKISKTWEKIFN